MKILREYTLDYVRRNKKSSLAIMIAILIATTLLSALSGFVYSIYMNNIRLTILETGDWHAELFDATPGDKLKYVTGHPNVENVMIKGTWEAAKIDDPRRPYLVMRGLTAAYWTNMPEAAMIMEGRVPQGEHELALSKQYFEHHPELKIGDSVTLPVGNRSFGGAGMDPRDPWKDGELFEPLEERNYTVVAKLDVTTNSMTPAYVAYGFMSEENISPTDELTVYMSFKNPRTAYEDIDRIAQSVGFKPDEYGKYLIRTNDDLLSKYLIYPPEQKEHFRISQFVLPLMLISFALLVTGVFVFNIHNAFAMSANARIIQLGMLKSIGASPRQIRHSVVFEAVVLALIPIPMGLFIGWLLDCGLFAYINSLDMRAEAEEIAFVFGLPAILPSIVLAVLTVWLSAIIPARRIARLLPIEAIRQEEGANMMKTKKRSLAGRIFGIGGELAQTALYARKRSYRTATVSLTLSFALLSVFMNFIGISEAWREVSNNGSWTDDGHYLELNIQDGNLTTEPFENEVRSMDGVESVMFLSSVRAGLWVDEETISQELQASGGLKKVVRSGRYDVYEQNGKYRIRTILTALDDSSFAEYCAEVGADPAFFHKTGIPRAIVVNKVRDDLHSNRRNPVEIPFLALNPGNRLQLEEKIYPEDTSKYTFEAEVGFLTNQAPDAHVTTSGYQLTVIMPRSAYLSIIENYRESGSLRAKNVYIPITPQSEELIRSVADKLRNVTEKWYGSGDYAIWNSLESEQENQNATKLMKTIIICISVFLAVIGISNVFSTVSGNLRQRQKEFAMLRSVGISPREIRRMLTLEGVFLGIMPILFSIPLNLIAVVVFLKLNLLYFHEFVPYMPIGQIAAFGAAVLLSVVLAYAICGRKLRKDPIVDVLKSSAV
ncbi:ABC transporter permease [Paenibacillus sp. M1]|uniref:ABC transporter permease n=1 Tax=Paenibacillus haidiansis TaxID=1574488 RepID=A0ABU7VT92_9BACL